MLQFIINGLITGILCSLLAIGFALVYNTTHIFHTAGSECALILSELDAPDVDVAEQLSEAGVYEFGHTLIFKDFTADELYDILCYSLKKFEVTLTQEAEKHLRGYISQMSTTIGVNARTMKLMARAIYQKVILRESEAGKVPDKHVVELADVEMLKWDGKKGKIGF